MSGGVHAGHPGEYKNCDHPDCRAHRYRYHKRWAYERSKGHKRLVDAGQVRLHIATLRGAGWSMRAIAAEADVSTNTVCKIASGDQNKLARARAAALLAVRADQVPTKASPSTREPFVPRLGATRRIQALLYMGWGHQRMREHSGVNTANLLHQQGRWITRSTHDKVAALYRELAMRRGPSSTATTYARQRGYPGPLDWEDIDNDAAPEHDTTGVVPSHDEAVVLRFLDGETSLSTTRPDREEIVRRWPTTGRPLADLERLGWKPERYRGVASPTAPSAA